MRVSEEIDWAPIMPGVAKLLLGDPNKALSTKAELRFGTNGSLSVDLKRSLWHDHEEQIGGGVLDLIRAYKGLTGAEAMQWLEKNGFIAPLERDDRGPRRQDNGGIKIPGGFPDFMDPKPIAFFEYFDDKGDLAYQVLKFPKTAGRRYMQRRPHDGGWVWGLQAGEYGRKKKAKDWWKAKDDKVYDETVVLDDAPRWLYRRDEVMAAKKPGATGVVFVCEGEKDVETMRAWGFTATTNAGGAKYWSDAFDDDLAGLDVIILPDNDDAGRQRADMRAATLRGKARRVRVLDISLHWAECPEKGDITDWKEQAGGDAEKFSDLIRQAVIPDPPKSRFGAIAWNQLDLGKPGADYLVDGLLTMNDTSIVGGASGSGKSFFTLHQGMCIARGIEFFGRQVRQGGVIYQAGEGGRGVIKRLLAQRIHFKIPEEEEIPFILLPSKVDLFSKEGDTAAFIDECKIQAMTMGFPLHLIVIDTLSKASAGAEENSGKDMGTILDNIDRIRNATGAHVQLVHHMNADGKKLRGHTSIRADVDQVITITNDEATKIKSAHMTKLKDDEDGGTIQFSLAQVKVAWDAERERDITSCVVLSVSEKEKLKKEQERQGISVNPTQARFLSEFFEASDKYGVYVFDEPDLPRAARGKTVVAWDHYVEVAVARMVNEEDPKKAKDRLRKAFNRMTDGLIKAGALRVERPFMWWTGKPVRGFRRTFPKIDVDNQRQTEMPIEHDDPEIASMLRGEVEIPF